MKTKAYPMLPAAPVTVTLMGALLTGVLLDLTCLAMLLSLLDACILESIMTSSFKWSDKLTRQYLQMLRLINSALSRRLFSTVKRTLSVGVPKESDSNERRVALTPEGVLRLKKSGFEVLVEKDSGSDAGVSNEKYEEAGARLVDKDRVLESDVILKVREPSDSEIDKFRSGTTLISLLYPARNKVLIEKLRNKGVTSFAMDQVPRTTKAQTFDALSSMANIAGYKAVILAAENFGRFFTGQMTAAGKLPPAKILVIGGGVAGLSAIATAKSLGAIVRGFDTRPAVREQVQSLGAQFLQVKIKQEGAGTGGYAKEMSKEFIEAQMKLFGQQAKQVDIIITTALIPGKPAPKLITRQMVESMKRGSVVVDLAAEMGGNCELTKMGQIVEHNGVKIIGYTDLVSRMSGQSSALYSNNISKFLDFLLDKEKQLNLDLNNQIVRGAIITHKNELLWPNPNPPMLDAAKSSTPKTAHKAKEVLPVDLRSATLKSAVGLSAGLVTMMSLGFLAPGAPILGMTSIFSLSLIAGYFSVWGVSPALHTPLMSITNAISGITAVGGLLILGGGYFPHSFPQLLASAAVLLSSVNIAGGFLVTKRMLDMFKRKTDPEEFNYLYGIPALASASALYMAHTTGASAVFQLGYLASSLCCIASITGLSSQKTSRVGAALGGIGVMSGIFTALCALNFPLPLLIQALSLLSIGGALGTILGRRVAVTELPQTVAGFHALVGLAAVMTSLGSYWMDVDHSALHKVAAYIGTLIGGVTFTGSIAAFIKLAAMKFKFEFPFKNHLNLPLAALNAVGIAAMLASSSTTVGSIALISATVSSFALGWNITNSIGGADMPVAITVLNSYSGWALCAEGFLLDNQMLTIVGSLIGSSGAILSFIMCRAMNRSLYNVIFGTWTDPNKVIVKAQHQEHVETNADAVAEMIVQSKNVVIVPGYGMAVGQAQHAIADIARMLKQNGVNIRFAIHPVAGRMPGQLNVLLAEVGVPYDLVFEMEDINEDFQNTDLVIVVGANDIVNSSALEDPNSPIAGMPVLEVWKAKHVVINKRTMGTGYADIDNPLFFKENSSMLLGGAKDVAEKLRSRIEAHYRQ